MKQYTQTTKKSYYRSIYNNRNVVWVVLGIMGSRTLCQGGKNSAPRAGIFYLHVSQTLRSHNREHVPTLSHAPRT